MYYMTDDHDKEDKLQPHALLSLLPQYFVNICVICSNQANV